MEGKVDLQKNILKELIDYSPKIILGTNTLIEELRKDRKDDTDELFALVVHGINWEIEVFNSCEDLLSSQDKSIDKDEMSSAVERLGKVLQEKDDIKIAACLQVDFVPFLEKMEAVAKKFV